MYCITTVGSCKKNMTINKYLMQLVYLLDVMMRHISIIIRLKYFIFLYYDFPFFIDMVLIYLLPIMYRILCGPAD